MTPDAALTPPAALPTPGVAIDATVLERVLLGGDLATLTPDQRLHYYRAVCESVGLNPLTRPLDYIVLNGKLTLYARRDATEQLRRMHGVSIQRLENIRHDDLYVVTAYAADKTGRTDVSTGAVSLRGLTGEALANALMKAETKAKRRVTLSMCGLGLLDELEVADLTVTPEAPEAPKRKRGAAPAAEVPAKPAEVQSPAPVKPLSTRDDHQPITRSQQRKMFALATEKRWSTDQLRALLIDRFGTEHSGELRRGDFDQVLTLIGRGPTPDNTYPDGPAGKPADEAVPF